MRAARALLLAVLLAPPARAEDIRKLPIGDPSRKNRDVPLALDAITDTATGVLLTPADLPKRLAEVRLLLVGEGHTDMDSHRIERRVIEELHRAGRTVLVGLEMYPYTEQRWLDAWSDGKLTEEAFLESSRWYKNWGYNWGYYRDIFLFARENRLRMVAVNAPREVVSAVRKKGFQGLTAEESAHIPTQIDTRSADHMRLFRASFDEASFHNAGSDEQWQAMLDAQCTWDATMGYNAVEALGRDADPKAILVVLVGAGHVQYGLGIERQIQPRFSGKVASLIPVSVADEKKERVASVRASYANFLWGTPPEGDALYPELGIATRPGEDKLLVILDVEKASPAARAGLAVEDVLLTMDGAAVADREALSRLMAGKCWGDAVSLTVRRGNQTVLVQVLLRREAARPSP